MSSRWVLDTQTRVYSKAKAMLTSKLKGTYPDIYITDDDETPSDPKFPAIFINMLQPYERGRTLDGQMINAIQLTVEVEVTVTKAQGMSICRDVAYTVLDVFKEMRFEATMPDFQNDGSGTKRMIARYSRLIGSKDTI